ncbi:FeoB-associated Cys-rich membrane protein [Dyadobacter sandarakinus]|uniref:FeoB-associated Cys-rich membrane protein n=1 Tax=Dyadobacter sandarakinus TaxID=2747268 RepID=A0ABX7I6N6_9BACT|nr:FeoB-associated Cys-rich membrane protein [Dyadobacter sandarakinus]QRR01766.1 FeoB-associated Cys-rich membrane protein [Dyadobacter sandarakinus]
MDFQAIIVLILFLAAAGYISWRTWKAFDRRNSGGCAKGCGCASDKAPVMKV